MSIRSLLRPAFVSYLLVIIALFLYSFTQIDLGLTLTRFSFFQSIQKNFQYIGYFNRPLSTSIFFVLIGLLHGFYFYFMWLAEKGKLEKKTVWALVIVVTGILLFSYNAFSYDLFNYIFDAKIVATYGQNPYEHKALDYPGDPMLGFMHWTHRVYPYGPVWLLLTVPLSFLGSNALVPTVLLFKSIMAASYLGCVYTISQILKKIFPQYEIPSVVFFAFNPLILIESLVSAHVDIVMLFFALFALYQLIKKNYILAVLLLAFSIGIKFATVLLLPGFVYITYAQLTQKKISWERITNVLVVLLIPSVIIASMRTNFQPWYLIAVISFIALTRNNFFIIPSVIFGIFGLLQYAPFLYSGNWDPPIPMQLWWLQLSAIVVSIMYIGIFSVKRLYKRK